jgi:hypothetical protein
MRAGTAQQVQPEWLRYLRAAKVGKAVRINRHSLDDYMKRQAYAGVEE